MTEDGNHEPEINYRMNKGRGTISKLKAFYGTAM